MFLFGFAAFASAEYGYTVLQYSDATCTTLLKTVPKSSTDDLGDQLNGEGYCDEEDELGFQCVARNVLKLSQDGLFLLWRRRRRPRPSSSTSATRFKTSQVGQRPSS
jgi:hypothetical protein